MKVTNFISESGNSVPNQYIITTNNGIYFQSYETIIAYIPKKGNIQLNKDFWNYSKTTSKYRNKFLSETKKETEQKINSGNYELADNFEIV